MAVTGLLEAGAAAGRRQPRFRDQAMRLSALSSVKRHAPPPLRRPKLINPLDRSQGTAALSASQSSERIERESHPGFGIANERVNAENLACHIRLKLGQCDENLCHLLGRTQRSLVLAGTDLRPHARRDRAGIDYVHLDRAVAGLVGIRLGEHLKRRFRT